MRNLRNALAGIAVAALLPGAAAADPAELEVNVVNFSAATLEFIYVRAEGGTEWDELVYHRPIAPGGELGIHPLYDEGCRYEMTIHFDDGTELSVPEFDFCGTASLLTDGSEVMVVPFG